MNGYNRSLVVQRTEFLEPLAIVKDAGMHDLSLMTHHPENQDTQLT
jgi:hypothetical protein